HIFQLSYRMLNNRDDALDVVQETFFRGWRSLKSFRGESSLRLWLETIATRICISRYRRKRILVGIEDFLGLGKNPDWDNDIDSDTHSKAIADALDTLTPKERAVFVLRMEKGHSTEETSEILGIAEGTVKAFLHRAKQKMQKELKKILPEEFK
ncbi:hypothetical protein DRQ33_01895, partial [bacterium]